MKRPLLAWSVLAVISLGCSTLSGAPAPTPRARETATRPAGVTPSATPPPQPTPTPAAIGPANLGQVQRLHDYLPAVESTVGADRSSLNIDSLAYSPDGRYVAVGGCVADVLRYQVCLYPEGMRPRHFLLVLAAATEAVLAEIPVDQTDSMIGSMAFSHDGNALYFTITYPPPDTFHPGIAKLASWDVASQEVQSVPWQGPTYFTAIGISPDDRLLATETSEYIGTELSEYTDIWDTAAGELSAHLVGSPMRDAFSPDGSSLATFFSTDGSDEYVIYDTATWQETSRLQICNDCASALSPDHSLLAVSDKSSTWIQEVASGQQVQLQRDAASLGDWEALIFTPDGRLLLGYSYVVGRLVDAWDTSDWQPLGSERMLSFETAVPFFADDGRTFLNGDVSEEIAIYGLP